MNAIFIILYVIISFLIFAGIVFLQKLLAKKHIMLGLIFPLIFLCSSIIIDIDIISLVYNSYLGSGMIEQYKNGMLIQKSIISTGITNIPIVILILVISNISTIVLFSILFIDRKKIKRKKELAKMIINDLE